MKKPCIFLAGLFKVPRKKSNSNNQWNKGGKTSAPFYL